MLWHQRLLIEHGAYCLGCRWALMLLLFAGGVMNLAVIAALTAWVLVEKLLPAGEYSARVSGALLIGTGVWISQQELNRSLSRWQSWSGSTSIRRMPRGCSWRRYGAILRVGRSGPSCGSRLDSIRRFTHTHPMKVVFVSGTCIQEPDGEPVVHLGPRSFMMQAGGDYRHRTSCNTDSGCVFFVESAGGFDMFVVEDSPSGE